ncbi:MAG TPA: hypothetical protein H9684_09875 [Firmicutes bacterium]|nr:hypothetical protein [Bacillota bacterium]
MLLSLCSILAMTGMFLYMFNKAALARTRRMALLPLLCAVIEGIAAGALTPALFPALTAVLVALRLVILLCCAGAMRQDAAAVRRRARALRRRAAAERAESIVTLPVARPVPMTAEVRRGNTRRKDIRRKEAGAAAGRCA